MIEATALGARAIIERIKEYGVPVENVVCASGIAEKSPFAMQVYADITGCTIRVAGSSQACALGAAVAAAVSWQGEHPDFPTAAREAMTSLKDVAYEPNRETQKIYDELYALYRAVRRLRWSGKSCRPTVPGHEKTHLHKDGQPGPLIITA